MQIKSEVFGRISGIKRGAVHDGEGIRTTVFFKGCPLRCLWCHNPESLSFAPEIGFYRDACIGCGSCASVCDAHAIRMENGIPEIVRDACTGCFACSDICPTEARRAYGSLWEAGALARKLLADKPFFDNSGGGVTISGGECLSQPRFASALAAHLHDAGVSVNIDTCGYADRKAFEELRAYTDVFLYDLKAVDPAVHRRCTGVDNARILDNLRRLIDAGCRVEIRYPYVPRYNDGECAAIGAFLAQCAFGGKIKVLGYHGFADNKYTALGMDCKLPETQPTAEEVQKAVECLRAFGLCAVNGMTDD